VADGDFVAKMVGDTERFHRLGFDRLTPEELGRVEHWLMDLISLFEATQGTIDEIRADGHLVRLTDGSLWEANSVDASTVDLWSPYEDVVILNGRMYRIDESESAEVERVDA